TAIMRYAVQEAIITHNAALDLEGAISAPVRAHRPALELDAITDLLNRIEGYKGRRLTVLAIRLTLLVFIRSSELRFARWPEIDFKNALWIIPPEREEIVDVRFSGRGS
ncbi:integrase, partial [Salmonella enterica subsp. enterica serovar Java]|nr:integrase [Salmonella enterica subsp. enterica serovar Java]